MKETEKKVIVALDYPTAEIAEKLVSQLSPQLCRLKIGKEMFTAEGSVYVKKLVERGFDIFLDLKYHDIPNTVASACRVAADMGVWMVNVHTLGGSKMMSQAKKAIESSGAETLLIGVTILTSHSEENIHEIGLKGSIAENVSNLAFLAKESGLDGVVCSAMEAAAIKQRSGSDFLTVTPGIRLPENDKQDQCRVMTPIEAVNNGADYLVIGRSVTSSSNPMQILKDINKMLEKN
ncbi:MAG: orotidine-5'-phosphate decarboxylase [Gammaproteobacteria bacterium]|nr:MAG: orotidine-5'-phosphate decarboxylase [Gammaproteobacteria bacterium]